MNAKSVESIPLSKGWRFRPLAEKENPLDDFDNWQRCDLPFQWQTDEKFRDYLGKGLYVKNFSLKKEANAKYELHIKGIFYYYDVYLNSNMIDSREGYFSPFIADVTKEIVDGENEIRLVVNCPPESDKKGKRLITGVFSHWDCLDETLNPAGIWGGIELKVISSPVIIKDFKVFLSDPEERSIHIKADIESRDARRDVTLTLRLIPHNFKGEDMEYSFVIRLSKGITEFERDIPVKKLRLWWPYELGFPALYDVSFSVNTGDGISTQKTSRTGFRTVAVDNYIFRINGQRLFIRGSNIPPIEPFLSEVSPEKVGKVLKLAKDTHMNMLRVHAHIDHPILYELADEMGILLWQDFPLQWLYDRSILPEAEKQAVDMVALLFPHPSVVVWCMHNEPIYIMDTKAKGSFIEKIRLLFSILVWSWNRDVMDKKLALIVRKMDDTRFVNPSSGTFGFFRRTTDTHLYFGWYYGKLNKLDKFMRVFPSSIKFVTEFGAQSFPNYETSKKYLPDDPSKIDWHFVETHYLAQRRLLNRWVGIDECEMLEDMVERTQSYQAELNRYYIDRLRVHKYRPCGGFLTFMLFDSHFAISWSVVDNELVPKTSYKALKDALNPVYAFALLDPFKQYPRRFELPIYAVNDSPKALPRIGIEVRVEDERRREIMKDVIYTALEPDSPVKTVGNYSLNFGERGKYTIFLRLRYDNEVLDNCYSVRIR